MLNLPSIQISWKDTQKAFNFVGSAISSVLIPEMAINFYLICSDKHNDG